MDAFPAPLTFESDYVACYAGPPVTLEEKTHSVSSLDVKGD